MGKIVMFYVGKYCEDSGMTNTTGDCLAGYYCLSGASTSAPVDGVTGDICAAGYYCPTGSDHQLPCVNGTYTNYTGILSYSVTYSCNMNLGIAVCFSVLCQVIKFLY